MAQLPPKIPNMTPTMTPNSWPSFQYHHQKLPSMGNLIQNSTHQQLSWVDEFLDFSTARRNAHRRSVSDSITFLEAAPPIVEECQSTSACLRPTKGNNEFDQLDDEQLMSMFCDGVSGGNLKQENGMSSNPSTSSDRNSNNNNEKTTPSDEKPMKNESVEVQSSCKLEINVPPPTPSSTSGDQVIDSKRVRRILANRQSAQRSRVRKLQYISELERSVTSLQTEVLTLSPRVAFLDHQRLVLNVDNSALKQRLAALAQDKIFKDAHQEALKNEIERLRKVYHEQNLKKMGDTNFDTADSEQLLN